MDKVKFMQRALKLHGQFVQAILSKLSEGDFLMTREVFIELLGWGPCQAEKQS